MTIEEKERYSERLSRIKSELNTILDDITNFDVENSPPEDLDKLFKRLNSLSDEVDDTIIELEVEDFLLNGPGIKDKNI